jgi:hypothetical protein
MLIFLLIRACAATPLLAQEDPQPPPANATPYTLHLYARLVELPTIILMPRHQSASPLNPKSVNIALDAGRPFHPASIRLEGDDPLSIAILLDSSSNDDHFSLIPAFSRNYMAWITKSLRPQDRITLYSLRCDLYRTSANQAPDSTLLQPELDQAVAHSLPHQGKARSACTQPIGLRDTINFIMRQLPNTPGRHVLLVLTDGGDDKSTTPWSSLILAATFHSVTLFALARSSPSLYEWGSNLRELVQHSGGFFFSISPDQLTSALNYDVKLLRARYILQFPMPDAMTGGLHHADVTLSNGDATIRQAGITVPLPNPAIDHPSTDMRSQSPDQPSTDPPRTHR